MNEELNNMTLKEQILEEFPIEKLADIEHQRWSDWQKYYHSKCLKHKINSLNSTTNQYEDIETGHYVIPRDVWDRAERQINTEYKDLSESEKQSDRNQVERYLPIIKEFISQALDRQMLEVIKCIPEEGERERHMEMANTSWILGRRTIMNNLKKAKLI